LAKRANSHSGITVAKEPLKDKVALLFDGATMDGRSLALSLARYGADIAIVCREGHARHVRETERLVKAEGRRCLVLPTKLDDESLSKEAVCLTAKSLGRFDIFIDFSSAPDGSADPAGSAGGKVKHGNTKYTGPFNNTGIMLAALDQIVCPDLANDRDDKLNRVE
jgi:NAD(P)-dependent dehydrogenase (short-subunit alcohol dehydrogenase family)